MVDLRSMCSLELEELTDDVSRRIALLSSVENVKKKFGFDLMRGEIAGLKYYINCFWATEGKNNSTDSPSYDAFHYFMVDYFGLDDIELGKQNIRSGKNKITGWKSYGCGFIGEESFKKYCQMNVGFWRDQRNLI